MTSQERTAIKETKLELIGLGKRLRLLAQSANIDIHTDMTAAAMDVERSARICELLILSQREGGKE